MDFFKKLAFDQVDKAFGNTPLAPLAKLASNAAVDKLAGKVQEYAPSAYKDVAKRVIHRGLNREMGGGKFLFSDAIDLSKKISDGLRAAAPIVSGVGNLARQGIDEYKGVRSALGAGFAEDQPEYATGYIPADELQPARRQRAARRKPGRPRKQRQPQALLPPIERGLVHLEPAQMLQPAEHFSFGEGEPVHGSFAPADQSVGAGYMRRKMIGLAQRPAAGSVVGGFGLSDLLGFL